MKAHIETMGIDNQIRVLERFNEKVDRRKHGIMTSLTEADVEQAALDWLPSLRWRVTL